MKRGPMLAAALVATLAATAWVATHSDADSVVPAGAAAGSPGKAPASNRAVVRPAAPAPAAAWPGLPRPRTAAAWPFDPDEAAAWGAPPPPVPPPPAPSQTPPPPAAAPLPPFPYALIGRFWDASGVRVLLNGPRRTLDVRPDDVIDGQWRVDAIGDAGITLTWLPGGQQKTVSFPNS
ncbi:MAG: hypothetical protein KGI90_07760 [Burkholderiales bacterium]|nr:hypothetical protein [Burkholderiales bacterium]